MTDNTRIRAGVRRSPASRNATAAGALDSEVGTLLVYMKVVCV
jgi:hypothetical protein